MLTRVAALLVVAGFFVGLTGCVSADLYRAKEQEVQTLYKTNGDIQEQNRSLFAEKTGLEVRSEEMKKENEGLKNRIGRQEEEIVYLKNRAETLEKDGKGLLERVEKLNAKIAELYTENQRLAFMVRPENILRTLGDRLTDLQKQVEAVSGENEKLKKEQVIARTRQEKAGGAQAEKTIASTGEKPQAVLVSEGQTAEGSKPDQQVQEGQEQPALAQDREKPLN